MVSVARLLLVTLDIQMMEKYDYFFWACPVGRRLVIGWLSSKDLLENLFGILGNIIKLKVI